MQSQGQKQNQRQFQLQLLSKTLNGFIESLIELDRFEHLPKTVMEATNCSGDLANAIDNCITQLNAPVIQARTKETYDQNKKQLVTITLKWISTRERPIDIIDELCIIYFYTCLGDRKEVPQRIQAWNGKVSDSQLQEFAEAFVLGQYEVNKFTKKIESGILPTFEILEQAKRIGDVEKGLTRIQLIEDLLSSRLSQWLSSDQKEI